MNKLSGLLVGCVLCLFPSCGKNTEANLLTQKERIEIQRSAKALSVMVIAGDSKGSGFVIERIGNKAIVLTNAHVVINKGVPVAPILVLTSNGKNVSEGVIIAAYQGQEKDLMVDYAFLLIQDEHNYSGQKVKKATSIKEGDYVVSIGSPLAESFISGEGVINKIIGDGVKRLVIHTALTEHGSSGGGLFNKDGELVGIQTAISADGKYGTALSCDILDIVSFYSTQIDGKESQWIDTGIMANKGDSLTILSSDRIGIGFMADCASDGVKNYDPKHKYSLYKEYKHGGLLAQIGSSGSVFPINTQWYSKDLFIAETKANDTSFGGLRFRINDTDTGNNNGKFEITIMKVGE